MSADLDHERAALNRLATGKNFADDVRVVRMALDRLAALSTPPADDVREALFDVIDQHQPVDEDYCACGAGHGPAHLTAALLGDRDEFGVLDVPAFEVRPRGTVTDAEVWAAARAMSPRADRWSDFAGVARKALGAAREARP